MDVFIWKFKQMIKPVRLLLLFFPLVAALLLGSLLEKQEKELVIPIGIVDADQSDYSRKIIQSMKEQERLKIHNVSSEKAELLLARNEVDSVFIIKKGFKKSLLNEKRSNTIELKTSTNSVAAGIIREVLASEVTKLSSAIMAANRVEKLYNTKGIGSEEIWGEAYNYTLDQWIPEPLMTVSYVQHEGSVISDKNVTEIKNTKLYLGLWSFFIMISCFITSDWIMKERELVFPRIKTTSKGLVNYFWETSEAHMTFYIINIVFSLTIFTYLEITEIDFELIAAVFIYVVFAHSVSIFTSSVMGNIGSYYVTAFILSFLVAFFGGSFFSLSEISETLEGISNWFPQLLIWEAANQGSVSYSAVLPTFFVCLFMIIISYRGALRRVKE